VKTITFITLLSAAALAADYSTMTMEQLQAMRGSVPTEERAAFQAEMQTRIQAMNPEERQETLKAMRQSRSGPMDGTGSQMRQGGGQGNMGMGTGGGTQRRGGR
jgi:hypothetical protein